MKQEDVGNPLTDALRRVARQEATLAGVHAERRNLKWFLVLAALGPVPAWVLSSWRMALAVAGGFMLFYVVGRYLNFMHVRHASQDVVGARVDLIRLEKRTSSRGHS